MNFCVDCKHHNNKPDELGLVDNPYQHQCFFRGEKIFDPVTGKELIRTVVSCATARSVAGHCKPDGIHFEPKAVKKTEAGSSGKTSSKVSDVGAGD